MNCIPIEHKNLTSGRWAEMSFAKQMANMGSEVSRSIKNVNKEKRFKVFYNRALELFDLTIDVAKAQKLTSRVKEVELGKLEFIDYFNDKKLNTDATKMQNYYDQFAYLAI